MKISVCVILLLSLTGCTSIDKRCEIALMEVEVYETRAMDPSDYLGFIDRRKLIDAKTRVIKWCDHPLSKED